MPALKDGRIADTIYATVNREDVGNDRTVTVQTSGQNDVEDSMLTTRAPNANFNTGVRNRTIRGVRDRCRERSYSQSNLMETDPKRAENKTGEATNRNSEHG